MTEHGDKKMFVEERIYCFKERFKNFLSETETDVTKRLWGFQRTKKRLVAKLEVLEGAETVLKKEQDKIKKALIALVGFDTEGTDLPQYKERKVEIDDSPTAYACTDESIE